MPAPRVGMLLALLLTACACKQKAGEGGGTGTATGASGDPAACDQLQGKVSGLYQAAAERTKMTPEEVADNTAMVIAECRGAPDRVIACARKTTSVAQLESQCLAPLDDEGSEGLQFQGK